MWKKGWRWAVIGALSLLALSGCSSSDTKNIENVNVNELVLAVGGEPEEGFDPTTGWGHYGSPLFQSTLLKRDKHLNIVNDLATDYDISEDGKVWTVQLRKDVKFSDGKPLTAEDVKFTFDTAAKNASVIDLTNLKEVKVINDYTVTFTLKEPQSTFLYTLVTLGIVPKHAYGKDYAEHPIGSGPYKLVQWDKGQQVIVEANPEYYGKKPYFKKITFLFLNEDAAFAAAKAKEVDVAYIPSAFSKQKVPGMRLEAIKTVDNRGIMFPFVPSGDKTKDGYPIGNDVTADIAIRKAINVAIDRKALVEGVLEGYGTPAYTAVDGLPWWNEQTVFQDRDIEEAKKILSDAGWKDRDGDGIVEKGSLKAEFTLLYPSGDVTRQSLALAVADMVKPIGIKIHVEGKSWDDIKKLMHSNAVLFGFGSHDPTEMFNLYSSSYQGVDYYNPGFYSNPVVDKWFDKALKAKTEKEALEYWKKAQWDGKTGLSALGDAPYAWLVNIDHLYLVNERLDIGEQPIHPHGHGWPITSNIEEWKWMEQKK
ncbi:ABC transporter substrate-binding protein [Parageobacillus thermoglucosidasius]|uniref:ABC transporter substrate-binding protein n=1 Tax=Parageobacillus thermoglucosidasius TaxID=1426 RepID=A0AB38QZN9_PARTM|nr:ABC transporter substrate-binding protein [Parageobacillus thermoglucosidasius]UOE76818.1 ABC transporter substrate-binding protein [Parageobacillus thermoglucosidasius]